MFPWAVRWLEGAVEQYETLPVADQILIDNALAQIEQDAAGPDAGVPHPDGAWSIAAGTPTDHLFAHTVVIGGLLVITRIVADGAEVRVTRPPEGVEGPGPIHPRPRSVRHDVAPRPRCRADPVVRVVRAPRRPTVTVPPSPGSPLVVVGVDGSPGSQHALDFAIAEAELRGAAVRAVCTWDYPVAYGGAVIVPFENLEAGAGVVLADAIALATKDAPPTAPPVTAVIRRGHASQALIAEARDATLLVVGSRGHGGFVGLLIGSISQGCVTHAPCPVVVVPAPAA